MPFEHDMLAYVRSESDLINFVGQRIYPAVAPEKTPTPYFVWTLVSATSEYSHDGESGREYTFQFSIFDDSLARVLDIRDILYRLSGARVILGSHEGVVVTHSGTRQTYEPATKLYHVSVDFTFSVPA